MPKVYENSNADLHWYAKRMIFFFFLIYLIGLWSLMNKVANSPSFCFTVYKSWFIWGLIGWHEVHSFQWLSLVEVGTWNYLLHMLIYELSDSQNFIDDVNVQGFIVIRDEESITSRIRDVAPKFLWEVKSHLAENKEKKMESLLICRKRFWAIVWSIAACRALPTKLFIAWQSYVVYMSREIFSINPPCFALEGNRFKLKRRQLNIIENLKVQFVMYLGSIVVLFLCFIYWFVLIQSSMKNLKGNFCDSDS